MHPPLWRALYGGRADGCGHLRTVADGCEHKRNLWRSQPHPQTPKVKGEPSLRIRENYGHTTDLANASPAARGRWRGEGLENGAGHDS